MQTVRAASILLASAFAKGFRLLFGPTEREAADGCDAVDKDHVVSVEIFERAADAVVMSLAVARGCRIARVRAADAAGEIARGRPVVDAEGVDRQIQHAQVASFDIDEEGTIGIKRAK